ncbi:hypothetical protein M430DRAFT_36090 [Amorphotheca resinae ATCC 22711]|uniref:Uncharacterized protein n=1 Tax=Amorphotheca resinae ATCC 22711 TaxID=857342 RepID=A0A2T3AW15_AMORE|nr:hypothetical protein M430DRAFT_36090 [Amorphotheca resinae ATCC 22711]PSS12858.1 hypothetical protein M430DRAFT_36090 [Amorphotheca resinae ATCC 22711]
MSFSYEEEAKGKNKTLQPDSSIHPASILRQEPQTPKTKNLNAFFRSTAQRPPYLARSSAMVPQWQKRKKPLFLLLLLFLLAQRNRCTES